MSIISQENKKKMKEKPNEFISNEIISGWKKNLIDKAHRQNS